MSYSDLIYSQFPDELDDGYEYMQDISSDLVDLVNEYESLISQKRFSEANQLLVFYPKLNNIYFNAEKYNKLIDSIRATQRFYKEDLRTYILELVNYKGKYSEYEQYDRYNVVDYGNMIYICIALNTPEGTLPTDKQYWYPLSIKGEQGVSGFGLSPRGIWRDDVQYYEYDLVGYNNSLWTAINDNINSVPENSDDWYCVLTQNFILESMEIQNDEIDAIFH